MSVQEQENLGAFLFRYWFDRPKDDQEIALEVVLEESPESVSEYIRLLRLFTSLPATDEFKAEFVFRTLRKRFPQGPAEAVAWLLAIAVMLDQAREPH